MKDKIWINNIEYFMAKRPDCRHILLRNLSEKLKMKRLKKILDFGCGEGYLTNYIDKNVNISLFDINKNVLRIAKQNAEKNHIKNINIYDKINDIKQNQYDIVILSLVLVTSTSKKEFVEILRECKRALKSGGELIIGDTHPCFRDRDFSTFNTDYSESKKFDYNQNMEKFKVKLKTYTQNDYIEFKDIHYTLGFLFESVNKLGFRIEEFDEIKDQKMSNESYYNKNFPPFYILTVKNI